MYNVYTLRLKSTRGKRSSSTAIDVCHNNDDNSSRVILSGSLGTATTIESVSPPDDKCGTLVER